jgi:protein-L-isoaspartate(D-aspartate) O-methyltransferase
MPPAPAQALIAELRATIADERVLGAIASVPRERFVTPELREHAYDNVALPIGHEQTISQPLVVARMLALLQVGPGDRVLDVGTGSGYHAALMARLGAHVWSVERNAALSAAAAGRLREMGISTVTCTVGDGTLGLPEQAPFDAINVAASAAQIPIALERQMAIGGRLVVPVGTSEQYLVRVARSANGWQRERYEPVRFVPLIGAG